MKFTLTFATNYNGIDCSLDDVNEAPKEIEEVCQKIAETLPSLTHKFVGKFDKSLTNKEEKILCDIAKAFLSIVVKEPFEVSFEYDYTST